MSDQLQAEIDARRQAIIKEVQTMTLSEGRGPTPNAYMAAILTVVADHLAAIELVMERTVGK